MVSSFVGYRWISLISSLLFEEFSIIYDISLQIPYQMSPAPMNCPVQQLQVHQQHLNDLQLPVLFEENCTRVPCRPQLEEVPPKHTFVGHQKLHEAFVEAVCFGTM